MPTWLVALLVGIPSGLLSGLVGTLLRLQHDRATDLRTRMLDAADDFIAAYTVAQEAVDEAIRTVRVQDSLADEIDDLSAHKEEWLDERRTSISSANELCDAVTRRQPRIALLFNVDSPTNRSARLVSIYLSHAVASLNPHTVPSSPDSDGEEDHRKSLRTADRHADEFSRRAREAILASPWGIGVKVRSRYHRAKRRLSRGAPWGGDLLAPP